jgi:hypothetical protein
MFSRNFSTKCYFDILKMKKCYNIDPFTLHFYYKRSLRNFVKDSTKAYETIKSPLNRAVYLYEVDTKERIHLPTTLENHTFAMLKNYSLKDLQKIQLIYQAEMLSLQDLINSYYTTKDYARMKVVILELNEKHKIMDQILTEKDKHYLS